MNPETGKLEPLTIGDLDGGFQLLRPDGTPVPQHWTVFTVDELEKPELTSEQHRRAGVENIRAQLQARRKRR